jgi:hypothetical protein
MLRQKCREEEKKSSGMVHTDEKEAPDYVIPSETHLRRLLAGHKIGGGGGETKRNGVEVETDADVFRPTSKKEDDDVGSERRLLREDTEIRIAEHRARRTFGQSIDPEDPGTPLVRDTSTTCARHGCATNDERKGFAFANPDCAKSPVENIRVTHADEAAT